MSLGMGNQAHLISYPSPVTSENDVMQVDYLFVIVFTDSSDARDEVVRSGRYLYGKTRQREPLSKCLVRVDTSTPAVNHFGSRNQASKQAKEGKIMDLFASGTLTPGFSLIDGSVAPGFSESDNVGVYLVFHCSQMGVPYLFDRAFGLQSEVAVLGKLPTAAAQLTAILLNLGLEKIRKLCLVACTTAKGNPTYQNGFLGALCEAMAGKLQKPPLIAGWDDYVTVVEGGHKQISENRPAKDFPDQKHVAVWKGQKYEIGRLENSGWSDKNQGKTELGPSSTYGCSIQ